MTEFEEIEELSLTSKFLELDPLMFDLPDSHDTLGKIINQFNVVAEKIGVLPVIENETDQPYYKYKFDYPFQPYFEISLYTPGPNKTDQMMNMNTYAKLVSQWPYPHGSCSEIRPIKNDKDKKDYLLCLQLLIALGLQSRYPDSKFEHYIEELEKYIEKSNS